MAGNIPGTNNSVLPGVYSQVETQTTGVSIPGGTRIVAIIGEGVKEEVVVAAANGGGKDGFNPSYTSASGSDGRHFKLSGLISPDYPIVQNTFTLKKKTSSGSTVLLNGVEESISATNPLASQYDYRIELNSGKIELQTASYGTTITAGSANVGTGTITLYTSSSSASSNSGLDPNAPPEKWVVKCISVQRDPSGTSITGTAKFIAFGSVSGNKLKRTLGSPPQPVVWDVNSRADNGTVDFMISETTTPFDVGDSFTFEVKSGVLAKDDVLIAEYVPSANLNDPTFLDNMNDIATKHGTPSKSNTLSLGAQLAFANGAPGVMCVQARPSSPKRTSYSFTRLLDPSSTNDDDFMFALPSGVVPHEDFEIHFFMKDDSDPAAEERQYLPNKEQFGTVLSTADISNFVRATSAPDNYGYTFSQIGSDGYVIINENVALTGYSLRVTLVDSRDADNYDAGWLNALESLEAQDVDIVVPLPRQNISTIFQNTLTHCKVASSIKNKRERVLFCGAIRGLSLENLKGDKLVAVEDIGVLEGVQGYDDPTRTMEDLADYSVPNAFGYGAQSYRSVYFYPDEIVVQAGGQNEFVDGFYAAAAAGGYLSANTNIAMPLTNKVLSGFTILRNKKLTNLAKEQMADCGITVLDPVAGGGRVVWGKTTTKSGYPEEEEISIVFIRDRIAKVLRESFAGYIGLPEDDSLPATLTARAVSVLNSLVNQGLITQHTGLLVSRDSVDPRQWNISVKCQPAYPVNFIFVKVSLGII